MIWLFFYVEVFKTGGVEQTIKTGSYLSKNCIIVVISSTKSIKENWQVYSRP